MVGGGKGTGQEVRLVGGEGGERLSVGVGWGEVKEGRSQWGLWLLPWAWRLVEGSEWGRDETVPAMACRTDLLTPAMCQESHNLLIILPRNQ